MKKLSLLFIMGLISLTTFAKAGIPDYIITGDGIKYYSKVRYGLTTLVGVENNARERYSNSEILAYRKNGKVYEKVPVVVDNRHTGRYNFMELIGYRNGLKVYKSRTGNLDQAYEYFVYRNNEFVVQFDQRNAQSLNTFFFQPYGLMAGK